MAAAMIPRLSAGFLFGLFACNEPKDPAATTPWLELGTGLSEYIPVTDGDELPLVYGIQGGWHVDTSAQFGGVALDGASLTYHAIDPDSGAVLNYAYDARLQEDLLQELEDGWLRLGDRVVFDVRADTDILGRTLDIEVTLTDAAGGIWQDTHTIVVVAP